MSGQKGSAAPSETCTSLDGLDEKGALCLPPGGLQVPEHLKGVTPLKEGLCRHRDPSCWAMGQAMLLRAHLGLCRCRSADPIHWGAVRSCTHGRATAQLILTGTTQQGCDEPHTSLPVLCTGVQPDLAPHHHPGNSG